MARDISLNTEEYCSKRLSTISSDQFTEKKNFVLVLEGKSKNPASTTFHSKEKDNKKVKLAQESDNYLSPSL